jgi:hypothetical protein
MEDGGDVFFPEASSFGVALKGVLNGKNVVPVKSDAKASFVPISICIITAVDCVVECSGESKE